MPPIDETPTAYPTIFDKSPWSFGKIMPLSWEQVLAQEQMIKLAAAQKMLVEEKMKEQEMLVEEKMKEQEMLVEAQVQWAKNKALEMLEKKALTINDEPWYNWDDAFDGSHMPHFDCYSCGKVFATKNGYHQHKMHCPMVKPKPVVENLLTCMWCAGGPYPTIQELEAHEEECR